MNPKSILILCILFCISVFVSHMASGVSFKEDQLIVRLKHGYLDYPQGQNNVPLYQCDIEDSLWNLLTNSRVVSIDRVFGNCYPGDTIRVVHNRNCRVPDLSQIYILHLQHGVDVLETIECIKEHYAVLYAEPNHTGITLLSTPDDSLWDDQWALHDPDDSSNFGIGCPTAWNHTTGDSSIKIAIIDSGVEYTHDDLGNSPSENIFNCKVVGGWDYEAEPEDSFPYPGQSRSHGTNCAGIAAAITNNDYGIAGVAGGWWDENDTCDTGAQIYAFRANVDDEEAAGMAEILIDVADPNGDYGCQILTQ